MKQYVLRAGLEPIPGIGPGPLSEADYLAREVAYMAAFEGDAEARTPRETGVYVVAGEDLQDTEDIIEASTAPKTTRTRARGRKVAAPIEAEE